MTDLLWYMLLFFAFVGGVSIGAVIYWLFTEE